MLGDEQLETLGVFLHSNQTLFWSVGSGLLSMRTLVIYCWRYIKWCWKDFQTTPSALPALHLESTSALQGRPVCRGCTVLFNSNSSSYRDNLHFQCTPFNRLAPHFVHRHLPREIGMHSAVHEIHAAESSQFCQKNLFWKWFQNYFKSWYFHIVLDPCAGKHISSPR